MSYPAASDPPWPRRLETREGRQPIPCRPYRFLKTHVGVKPVLKAPFDTRGMRFCCRATAAYSGVSPSCAKTALGWQNHKLSSHSCRNGYFSSGKKTAHKTTDKTSIIRDFATPARFHDVGVLARRRAPSAVRAGLARSVGLGRTPRRRPEFFSAKNDSPGARHGRKNGRPNAGWATAGCDAGGARHLGAGEAVTGAPVLREAPATASAPNAPVFDFYPGRERGRRRSR